MGSINKLHMVGLIESTQDTINGQQLQTRTVFGSLSPVAYLSMGISEEKISLEHFFSQGCAEREYGYGRLVSRSSF